MNNNLENQTNNVNVVPVKKGGSALPIVIVILVLIILGLVGYIIWNNMDKEESAPVENNTTTTTTTSAVSKAKSKSKIVNTLGEEVGQGYCTESLILYDGTLYANIKEEYANEFKMVSIDSEDKGYKIMDNVKSAYFVEIGQSEFVFLYVIDNEGKAYYINNYHDRSKDSAFNVSAISELTDVAYFGSNSEDGDGESGSIVGYAYLTNGSKVNLYSINEKYSNFK